jgi:hypothetical protein
MIRKIAIGALCALVILSLVGCASVKTAESFAGLNLTAEQGTSNVAHYNARCWGIYFLKWALISGDNDNPNKLLRFKLLTDTATLDPVVQMLSESAAADGATTLEDLSSMRGAFPVIFPPIIFFKSASASANGIR